MADATVTGFSSAARDILQVEATEGVLSYAGGGRPSSDEPAYIAADTNILKYFRQLCNQVAALHARPPLEVDVEQVAAAVLAGLPDTVLTQADVTEAVLEALRTGTGTGL